MRRMRRLEFSSPQPYSELRTVAAKKQTASGNQFRIISATSSLASWFGLLLRFRLSSCSTIAVKQNAVRSQITDQRVQIVSQLLIVQKSRHQAFALSGAAKHLARVSDRVLQIVSCFFRGSHSGTRLIDDSI